jgi:hypothetical protein
MSTNDLHESFPKEHEYDNFERDCANPALHAAPNPSVQS